MADRVAAFFDFDGTIIDGYSAVAFLRDRFRRGDLPASELAGLVRMAIEAGDDIDGFMRFGVQAFRGTDARDLDRLGRRLLNGALGALVFPDAAARIAEHRAAGHTVVIASSALPFQIRPLAEELDVEHVLCTQLEQVDGVLTGRVDGPILWDRNKADAVRTFAAEHGIDLDASHAYGNGDEDIAFLSTVGHPHPVNPGDELAKVAERNGWPIERFEGRGRPRPEAAARTVAAYAGLAAGFGAGLGVGLLKGSRRAAVNTTLGTGADLSLALAGVRVNVTGREHLWSQRPAVFIFNHQSILDGLVVMKLVRRDVTGVSKQEVAAQPLMGQIAKFAQMALIDRRDPGQAIAAMEPVVERLREGYSIAISPEGTRAPTTKLLPFKKGPFHMAMQGGVPVVPMVFRGAGDLLWRKDKIMRAGTIDVVVHPPVSTSDWSTDTLDEHIADVRAIFERTLADWPA